MDQAEHTFHVTLRFEATGKAIEGTWASQSTAEYCEDVRVLLRAVA
ncbi:hypothetical protein [Streptomyces violascens]